jgi:hypothetical protein
MRRIVGGGWCAFIRVDKISMTLTTKKPRGVHKLTATEKHVGMDVPDEIGIPLVWARMLKRIRKAESGCWLWTGYIMPLGYVQISYKSARTKAHHVAYWANKGPVPEGMRVMHSCDVRHCLNPDHLSLGTQSENIIDAVKKGRQFHRAKTHCPAGHAFSEHGRLFVSKTDKRQFSPWRQCRVCQRIAGREFNGLDEPIDLTEDPEASADESMSYWDADE